MVSVNTTPDPEDALFAAIYAYLRQQRAGPPPGRVRLEVLEVTAVASGLLVTARALAGMPRPGMRLVAEGSSERWEVRSAATASTPARQGCWALALAPMGHARPLLVGAVLEAV